MNCGIYSIVSPSGKIYIGSSSNIDKRWKHHKYLLNRGDHHNKHLQNAWNKYSGALEFNILLVCDSPNLLDYEQQYLDFYQPAYNIAKSSRKAFYGLGVKRSPETCEKISKALMGKNTQGHVQSEASKQKLSIALRGNKNGLGNKANLGRKLPESTRQKMREAAQRRKLNG